MTTPTTPMTPTPMTPMTPMTPTTQRPNDRRYLGDPDADGPMAAFAPELTDPRALLKAVAGVMHSLDRPPGALGDWLATERDLPEWADRDLMRAGQQVFQRWGLQIGAVLFGSSLPWAYAAEHGVQSLARSSDLFGRDVRLRIAETGQMLVDTCGLANANGASFDPDSQAYQTISGVRMLHAAVRRALPASPDWQHAWGLPINQEDLAGTLLTFTTIIFDGLPRLGVALRPEEEFAYLHLWSVIGHFLGVDHSVIPRDLAAARALQTEIASTQLAPCEQGRRLMQALLAEMELSMPRGLKKVPRTFVHHLAGPQVCDILDVPAPAWWAPILSLTAAVGRRVTPLPGVRAFAGWPGRVIASAMFRMYIDAGLKGRRPRFRIEAEEAKRWRLGTNSARVTWRERRLAGRRQSLVSAGADTVGMT